MFPNAQRTRARRMTARRVREGACVQRPRRAARLTHAHPRRREERRSSTRSGTAFAWRDTTWLGQRVPKAPTDLVRVPGARAAGTARLDHRDRHGQRRARACSSRRSASSSDTARSSRSTPRSPKTAPSTRASRTSKAQPQSDEIAQRVREMVGDGRTRSWCSVRSREPTSASKPSSTCTRRSFRSVRT